MFKNYLKIAFRHITRNKTYVIVNVVGLGLALACCIIAFVNYNTALNADTFHEQQENIFRIVVNNQGLSDPAGNIATPFGPKVESELSAVKSAVRYVERGVIAQLNEEVFNDQMAVVDPNFLDVFSYPLIEGGTEALKDPSKVLITEKIAKKYFGASSALGQTIIINPGQEGQKDLAVGGVLKDLPHTTSLEFDLLTNIAYLEWGPRPDTLTQWKNSTAATFVLLNNPEERQLVVDQLQDYITQYNAKEVNSAVNFLLIPMKDVFLYGMTMSNNWINRGLDNTFYWGLGVMALLILLTACLNFTNTTISFSNKRLKEMGVRKVMGGGRRQIMFQLLGECLVICSLAAAFAVILAEYLLPLFNQMWEFSDIELALNYTDRPDLLLFIGGTILLVTLLAGAYPAFYISSFKPSQIFRGSTRFGGDNLLIRSLLGLQIIVSLVSIIGGITFAQNSEFQKNFDLGYDTEGIINVNINGEKDYNNFKQLITQNPDILGVAGARNNLGFGNWWNPLGKREDNRWVQVQLVGEHFFEVMGLDIREGRPFDKELATDYEASVVVNQKFLKDQQWESGLGKQIEMYDKTYNVVGVVDDFYQESFMKKPSPNVFHFEKPEKYKILKVKVDNDKIITTNKYLENTWKANFPLLPFSSYYQNETVAIQLGISKNVAFLNLFLAIVSILLATIGLYSLVSLNVLKRAKEIAVRRVLGATAENITYTINKHYVIIFAVAGILGGLIGGWFTGFLLEQIFQVNQGVNILSVILAIIGICIVGALTIGGKLYTVLQTNPAETLKSE